MTTPSRIRQKLLDGRYRWGHLMRRTGRYGAKTIRVVIYPPQSTEAERRCARLARFWPWIGGGCLVVAVGFLDSGLEVPILALVAAVALLVGFVGIALGRIAAPVHRNSVVYVATVPGLSEDAAAEARFRRASRAAEALHEAEEHLDAGLITWDWYRALWDERHRDLRAPG
jgi:hypothetical protein